ncbi:unnamed protein product [Coffea canephora]|uniref:Uncharacterized protein n=1 Tax=Coffea canephora TaxID=49390 RepID=A0A068VAV7_COFCA|nr:unnamed protein product [Coffea canephora]
MRLHMQLSIVDANFCGWLGKAVEWKRFLGIMEGRFLDRTFRIDKVIRWAPQAQVLAHPAVQRFVTHCNWNSVLESESFEVPVAVWPMYAEQQMNAFLIVKDLGIAAKIKMEYKNDIMNENDVIVKSNEIEDGIRQLM